MLTRSLVFLALLTAQPLHALSCLAPDVVRNYEYARDSEDTYSMVIGRIEPYGPIAVPEQDLSAKTDRSTETQIRLTGRALTANGFTAEFQRDVTLRIQCVSVWCAGAPDIEPEVFVTLRHDGDARVLDIGPCLGNATKWTAEDEARVLNCHRFQKCATP
jgi:hypothetical protein